jgi:CubicO group peptidase (beta-lactamase class C family)
MRRYSLIHLSSLVALLLACVLLVPAAAAPSARTGPSARLNLDRIETHITATMAERGIPGAALAIVHEGEVVRLAGYGRADAAGRPVTPQTPFRIGSLTKSFTALAIMQLVEQGQVALDAPVQRYLPWFRLADPEASAQITVAHLLHQTSGIPASVLDETIADPALSLEAYVRRLAEVTPDRPVGSAFAYSNANYNALGLIVERVSGVPYAEYIQQHILTPLGMANSFATTASPTAAAPAQGHTWIFGRVVALPDHFSAANLPAGYLSASAEDLARYLIVQMSDGRSAPEPVLSPEGFALMHKAGPNAVLNPTPELAAAGYGYGMGWGRLTYADVPAVFHNGSDARFTTYAVMLDNGWGFVLLINAANAVTNEEPIETMAQGITRLLYGSEPVAAAEPLPQVYLRYNALMALVSLWTLFVALRLPAWARNLRAWPAQGRTWRTAIAGLRVVAEVGLALAALVLAPLVFGPWELAFFSVPDIAWWLAGTATLLLGVGLLRGLLLIRILARPAASPAFRQRAA